MEERFLTKADLSSALVDFGEQIKKWFVEVLDQRFEEMAIMVKQGFDAVDQRFKQVDQRFEQVDQRFEAVDRRFDTMDRRFDTMDQRFDKIESRLGTVEHEVTGLRGDVRVAQMDIGELRVEMRDGFARINSRIDQTFNHIDGFHTLHKQVVKRLVHLESKQPA